MKYRAVCFDFDYTLGDATDAIVAGYTYALERLGWPAPEREAVRRTIGYMLEDGYTMLTGDGDPERRKRLRPLFAQVAIPLQIRDTRLFPGAAQLLRGLKERGVKLGIVSSKRTDTLRAVLERNGVLPLLDLIIGSDLVTRHKPDPEGLLAAMERLGCAPEETLYCGDTVMDAAAAQGAGADFCAVLNGTTPAREFEGLPHVHIAPDLWEAGRWLGLPPGDDAP